jgi:hypothetical protein
MKIPYGHGPSTRESTLYRRVLSVMSAIEKEGLIVWYMYLGYVISGFARKRWVLSFENLPYRSYKGLA